jgi:hypothetical protein
VVVRDIAGARFVSRYDHPRVRETSALPIGPGTGLRPRRPL